MLFGSKTQKRPEANEIGSGRMKIHPRFHLNSHPADGHFIPGNGGGRRGISSPLLQGAFSPVPVKARTSRLLSAPGGWGYCSLSTQHEHFMPTVWKSQELSGDVLVFAADFAGKRVVFPAGREKACGAVFKIFAKSLYLPGRFVIKYND